MLVRHVRAALERTAAAAAGLDRGDPAAAVRQLDLAERLCLSTGRRGGPRLAGAPRARPVRRGTRRRRLAHRRLAVLLAHAEGRAPRQAAPDVLPAGRALAGLERPLLAGPVLRGPAAPAVRRGTRRGPEEGRLARRGREAGPT
ncbi:hypothetical protein SGLAM104S_08748 [Streptomyces glaucescens]